MTGRAAVLRRALLALAVAGGLLVATATPGPAAAQTAGATSAREPPRVIRGQPYTHNKVVLFCLNRPALDALVALRRGGDLYTITKGCFAEQIIYFPEKRVKGLDDLGKVAFPEPDGPDLCTLKTGEKKNCRIEDVMIGFVQALMEYRGNMIEIYVQVDADLIVVEPE